MLLLLPVTTQHSCQIRQGCCALTALACCPVPQEQWQDLQLLVRTTSAFREQMSNFLLRSIIIFWPLEQLRLVVVLDAEKPADVAWKNVLEEELDATGGSPCGMLVRSFQTLI